MATPIYLFSFAGLIGLCCQLVLESCLLLIDNCINLYNYFVEFLQHGQVVFESYWCTRFTGATGRAFLFNKAVNLVYSEVQDRVMLTGRHMVRDVSCKNCDTKLGWIYEFATEENQRYKEGRVILERALVTESEGIEERV
ncbi:protein yippee-like 5 [Trichonephila inaurata madagascariensis]|uniref:Protein yippee-like n=1 Tax=Trichonephila inaurata madagascariensis TaxID=2747483 RepID=A0A8X6X1H7_9ARAC|nr:protein yippee-like 5 [Trichonephila inaurata madagascariensis]